MTIILIIVLGVFIPILLMYLWQQAHPPFLSYHMDGTVTDEINYTQPLHREDGPALIIGRYRKEYWVRGEQHNLDGPAVVNYGIGGDEQYYVRNVEIKKKTFLKIRYCSRQQIAIYLVSPRKEIRELAEHRLKELYENYHT